MIEVKTFVCNPLQENCYVVSCPTTREAAVIDCGAFYDAERQAIVKYINERQLSLRHVLCTHGHMDHIFGVNTLYDAFQVKPRVHDADAALYYNMEAQTRSFLGVGLDYDMPPLGPAVCDGETITIGEAQLRVIHTPGHSPGCVLLLCEKEHLVFTGDTLFRMSVGRTDLDGGSWEQLMQSLQTKVALLPADTRILPGHGPASVIADELRMNPYLKSWRIEGLKN